MNKRIQKLVSQGDQDIAIQELLKATKDLENPRFHQEAVALSARWSEFKKQKRQNTSSFDEQRVLEAQITNALLELAQQLPEVHQRKAGNILSGKWAKWSGGIIVGVGLLAGLAQLSGYSIKDLFGGSAIESFSVSVLVHGKEGRDDKIITNGKVILDIGGNRIEEEINSQGEAIFPALRKEYIGKSAFISLDHPQPYYPTNRDQEYTLKQGQSIYLEVALIGLNKIYGKVLDFETEQMLDSVRVSVRNAFTYTDQYGKFELTIPDSIQDKTVEVQYVKSGYQVYFEETTPHLKPNIGIALKPINP